MTESLSDIELLRKSSQHRDRQAFSELFQRHQTFAFNLSFHIVRDRALAEDSVQDAMLALWLSTKPIPDDANVRGWILSLVTTKSLNLLRQRKRQSRREESKKMQPIAAERVSETLADNELIAALNAQLDKLPEQESQVLACCYGANMSHGKIAEALGISRSTVTERIQQSLGRLRLSLKQAGLAAALPVINAEYLCEAFTKGHECPPGMVDRMMLRIESAGGIETASQSRRARTAAAKATKVGVFSVALAATAGVALLVAGLVWMRSPAAVPVATPVTASPAGTPFVRTWKFEKAEQAKDIVIKNGGWHFVPGGGKDGSGCMETSDEFFIAVLDLPEETLKRPLKVTLEVQPLAPSVKNGHLVGTTWADLKWAARFKNLSETRIISEGTWYTCLVHLTRDRMDTWTFGARKSLVICERQDGAKPAIYVRGLHRISEVTVQEISDADMPDASKQLDVLAKIEPSKRVGTVAVPELESTRPDKQVLITFETAGSTIGQ